MRNPFQASSEKLPPSDPRFKGQKDTHLGYMSSLHNPR